MAGPIGRPSQRKECECTAQRSVLCGVRRGYAPVGSSVKGWYAAIGLQGRSVRAKGAHQDAKFWYELPRALLPTNINLLLLAVPTIGPPPRCGLTSVNSVLSSGPSHLHMLEGFDQLGCKFCRLGFISAMVSRKHKARAQKNLCLRQCLPSIKRIPTLLTGCHRYRHTLFDNLSHVRPVDGKLHEFILPEFTMFSGSAKVRGGLLSYPFISVRKDSPAALAPWVRNTSSSMKARFRW